MSIVKLLFSFMSEYCDIVLLLSAIVFIITSLFPPSRDYVGATIALYAIMLIASVCCILAKLYGVIMKHGK